jgi:hypothetical protein
MAEQVNKISVAAPGFFGLNTQESPSGLNTNFALEATNCVIDKYGRVGARKGYARLNTTNTDLGSNNIQFIFELVKEDGNVVLSGGNNKLFSGRTTLTTLAVRNAGNTADLSYSITANHWQAASLPYDTGLNASQHAYIVQAAHQPIVYHKLPALGTGCQITVSTVDGVGAITAVTVSAGGSGYTVGDVLVASGGSGTGAKFTVTTVSSGVVTGVSITVAGTGYTSTNVLTTTDTTPHSHEGSYGLQRLADVGSLPAGFTVDTFKPNVVLAAYGRVWYADITGDKQTVYFSDLLDGAKLTGGSSGSLNIASVVPNNDPIVALAAHNNFLIIFCKRNTVIYANADSVADLTLSDVIKGIGCIARDTVQNTGVDIIFLSDTGLRSMQRVIQEKSLPFRDISKNVRDDLVRTATAEVTANIKSAYSPEDAFYVVALPAAEIVYCFDMRAALEDNSNRVTTWRGMNPRAFCITEARELLIGVTGYIGKYSTYLDHDQTFRFVYHSAYFDFGDQTNIKILKDIKSTVIGGSELGFVVKWGFDYNSMLGIEATNIPKSEYAEYGVSEYNIGVYSTGEAIARMLTHAGNSGRLLQVGFESEISKAFSIQAFDIFIKQGRVS